MKIKRKVASLFLAAILILETIFVPVYTDTAQAASAANKAKALYKKVLQKGKVSYKNKEGTHSVTIGSFCLLDIDQNGTPELVIKESTAGYAFYACFIFTSKNGKLKYCDEYSVRGDSGLRYSAKYKSLCYGWWTNGIGGGGNILYQLKKYKLREYKYIYGSQESQTSDKMAYWYGNNKKTAKKVSKKKYDLMYKKYFSGIKDYSFYDNTPANIKKYTS